MHCPVELTLRFPFFWPKPSRRSYLTKGGRGGYIAEAGANAVFSHVDSDQ